MRARSSLRPLAFAALAGLVSVLGWWVGRNDSRSTLPAQAEKIAAESASSTPEPAPSRAIEPHSPEGRSFLVAEKLLARLKTPLALEKARPNEAVLTFKDADAFRRFLARAAASGFKILGRLDALRTVRIGFDSQDALAADLTAHAGDYTGLDANYLVYPPEVPPAEQRAGSRFVAIGDGLLNFLGVTGDTSKWGAGVTIAVLDSGVVADATFGQGRLRYLDVGLGLAPLADEGHGTAVAALAAGMSPEAMGTAPDANILSIRVTGADGLSDSFTLAQGIIAAVDGGAQLVNISLGSYSNNLVMLSAIDYATARGALVVAAAGNDQAAQLTWPAADPRVISVGSVDAAEQQLPFSNSGDGLSITAPGYGVQTAWLNGQRVLIDGTSASTPVVVGSIAAMMSQNPGLSPTQAWQILQQYASDGGAPGPDPNYGNGILNLGWAMNRNDFNRIDTAVSSQFFDPSNFAMQMVVQNRSARGVGGLTLNVNAGLGEKTFSVPWLGPGGIYAVSVPADYQTLRTFGRLDYTATLVNPPGIIDAVPTNNARQNRITLVPSP